MTKSNLPTVCQSKPPIPRSMAFIIAILSCAPSLMLVPNFNACVASTTAARSAPVSVAACVFKPLDANFAQSASILESTTTAPAAYITCAKPCAERLKFFAIGIKSVMSCLASPNSTFGSFVASFPAAQAALATACAFQSFGCFFAMSFARFASGSAYVAASFQPSPPNVAIAHREEETSSVRTSPDANTWTSAVTHCSCNIFRSFAAPQSAFAASCAFAVVAQVFNLFAAPLTARRNKASST